MLFENMSMAFSAIKANKMRSFLTMLGIIIGIGSVISIVSIGDSMRALIASEYESIGINRAIIYVNSYDYEYRDSDFYTLDELRRFKEVFADDIPYVDSNASTSSECINGRNKLKINFQGIDYNYGDVKTVDIIYGRMLNEADVLDRKANVVLEKQAAIRLFGTADAIGKTFRTTIYGNTSDYYVVGVYEEHLSAFAALMNQFSGSNSEAGFIPYTVLTSPGDIFSSLNIYARDGVDLDLLKQRVVEYEAKLKNRSPGEILFYSAAEEMSSMDSMMSGLSIAVGAIAAISLVVGGIGIMNIMLVSVTERTREIGVRKALGAKTRDIMIQFLTESAFISAIGGFIGVAIGAGIVTLGGSLLGVGVVIKPSVIMMAVGFSGIVGIFFGIYPASKAAKSDPIDALRYE